MGDQFYRISGALVQEARLQKSISAAILASKLGVSRAFLSAVETGKRPVPKKWLPFLASFFKINEEDLKVYPQFQCPPWLAKGRVPNGFWDDEKNRRWFFEWLSKELNLECVSDLLSLKRGTVRHKIAQYGAEGMFSNHYKCSLLNATSKLFFEIQEKIRHYENQRLPRGASKDPLWVRNFLENLLEKLGYRKIEDLYKITCPILIKHGGQNLVQIYRPAPYAIIKFAFPEFEWLPWKFVQVTPSFWNDLSNLRWYLKWLSKELSYTCLEDFYLITREDFKEHNGSGLLSLNRNSPLAILIKAFPEYDWKPWLFKKTPQSYWDSLSNRRAYLKWLEERLGINEPEDWYTVTKCEFERNRGGGLLAIYDGSPARAAHELYPKIAWHPGEFGVKKKRQQRLYQIAHEIFPTQKILWEHKFENIRFGASSMKISVDVFIPSYNLAFEYQGEQHFKPFDHWGGEETLSRTQKNDHEKRKKLRENGITLIEIDYCWDGKRDSIEAKLLTVLEPNIPDVSAPNSANTRDSGNILSFSEIRNLSASWEMKFSQLKAFKEANGHCDILEKGHEPQLTKWLHSQFRAKKQGILDSNRIRRLEEIEVIWQDPQAHLTWDKQFANLEKYKEKHRHCDVNQYNIENPGLGRWVSKQRISYNKGRLEKTKIEQLESIGFCWRPRGKKWAEKIQALLTFRLKHGHCNVPIRWEGGLELARWVANLRRAMKLKKKGVLTPDRLKELNALGFVWDVSQHNWLKFSEKFKAFKEQNGHGRVAKGSALGKWLDRQRQAFKKGNYHEITRKY